MKTLFLAVLACAATISVVTQPILITLFIANVFVLAMCYLLGKRTNRTKIAWGLAALYLLLWFFTYLDSGRTVTKFPLGNTSERRQLSVEPTFNDFETYQLAPWVFTGRPITPCPFIVVFDQSSLNSHHIGAGVQTWVIWCLGKPYLIGREFRWAAD